MQAARCSERKPRTATAAVVVAVVEVGVYSGRGCRKYSWYPPRLPQVTECNSRLPLKRGRESDRRNGAANKHGMGWEEINSCGRNGGEHYSATWQARVVPPNLEHLDIKSNNYADYADYAVCFGGAFFPGVDRLRCTKRFTSRSTLAMNL